MRFFVDGSCIGNPGPMGIGIVAVGTDGERSEYHESFPQGTNNLAELLAVRKAAELAPFGAEIVTDSQYAVGGIMDGWRVKSHAELVLEIRGIVMRKMLALHWVRGHAGEMWNERANWLAQMAARGAAQSESSVEAA